MQLNGGIDSLLICDVVPHQLGGIMSVSNKKQKNLNNLCSNLKFQIVNASRINLSL